SEKRPHAGALASCAMENAAMRTPTIVADAPILVASNGSRGVIIASPTSARSGMIITTPSMSTNAVIMRPVSFPFIVLLARHQRGRDVSNYPQRFRRDLVHRVLRGVVRRVQQVDDIDHVNARVEQRNVIVGDESTAFLDEDVSI